MSICVCVSVCVCVCVYEREGVKERKHEQTERGGTGHGDILWWTDQGSRVNWMAWHETYLIGFSLGGRIKLGAQRVRDA